MTVVPSKFRRKTATKLAPYFMEVQIEGGTYWSDDQIVSIKIIHGTDGPEPGIYPARAEITIKGNYPILNGARVNVLNYADEMVVTGEWDMTWRFAGRITTQRVETTARGAVTVFQAASFITLALSSNLDWDVGANWGHGQTIGDLMASVYAIYPQHFVWGGSDINETDKVNAAEVMTISQGLTKFISDLGVYCTIERSGRMVFKPPATLLAAHDDCVAGPGGPLIYPLMRRDVRAPMDLSQTTENKNIGVKLTRRDATGAIVSGVWSFGQRWEETGEVPTEYRSIDWSYMKYGDNVLYRPAINAESHRLFQVTWFNDSVVFDIFHLLNDTKSAAYRYELAKAVLRIECGDWVPFGRDWPRPYRGAKLVTGFTETITPDEWTIELHVENVQQIAGRYGNASDVPPEIKSYPWDRYDRSWDTYSGFKFNDFPGKDFTYFTDIGD